MLRGCYFWGFTNILSYELNFTQLFFSHLLTSTGTAGFLAIFLVSGHTKYRYLDRDFQHQFTPHSYKLLNCQQRLIWPNYRNNFSVRKLLFTTYFYDGEIVVTFIFYLSHRLSFHLPLLKHENCHAAFMLWLDGFISQTGSKKSCGVATNRVSDIILVKLFVFCLNISSKNSGFL